MTLKEQPVQDPGTFPENEFNIDPNNALGLPELNVDGPQSGSHPDSVESTYDQPAYGQGHNEAGFDQAAFENEIGELSSERLLELNANLSTHTPSIEELDALSKIDERIDVTDTSAIDRTTGRTLDVAAADEFGRLTDPETWLLSSDDKAQKETVSKFSELNTMAEVRGAVSTEWLGRIENRNLDKSDVELPAIVAAEARRELALDAALRERGWKKTEAEAEAPVDVIGSIPLDAAGNVLPTTPDQALNQAPASADLFDDGSGVTAVPGARRILTPYRRNGGNVPAAVISPLTQQEQQNRAASRRVNANRSIGSVDEVYGTGAYAASEAVTEEFAAVPAEAVTGEPDEAETGEPQKVGFLARMNVLYVTATAKVAEKLGKAVEHLSPKERQGAKVLAGVGVAAVAIVGVKLLAERYGFSPSFGGGNHVGDAVGNAPAPSVGAPKPSVIDLAPRTGTGAVDPSNANVHPGGGQSVGYTELSQLPAHDTVSEVTLSYADQHGLTIPAEHRQAVINSLSNRIVGYNGLSGQETSLPIGKRVNFPPEAVMQQWIADISQDAAKVAAKKASR